MGIFSKLKKKRKLIEDKVKNDIAAEVARMKKEAEASLKKADVSPSVPDLSENVAEIPKEQEFKVPGAKVTQAGDVAGIIEDIAKDKSLIAQQAEINEELGIKVTQNVQSQVDEEWANNKTDFNKYVAGLDKSRKSFSGKINNLFKATRKIDEEFFEELENILIMNDVGVDMVMKIVKEIKAEVKNQMIEDHALIKEIIADKMFVIYSNWSHIKTTLNVEDKRLNVILMVGVNGAGKTTTMAKLAYNLIQEGKKVLFAAGDTFRAGAVAQLGEWANRLDVECVEGPDGGDPAAVIFDALKKAKEGDYDVLICDTAGRLQNKVNLMKELEKINKIIGREVKGAPHETLLVIDATTGQNGVSQAKHFSEITNVSGIVLSKMDGSSKGGIILSVKEILDIPVKFMGLGEKLTDLEEFDLDAYIYGLTKDLMD